MVQDAFVGVVCVFASVAVKNHNPLCATFGFMQIWQPVVLSFLIRYFFWVMEITRMVNTFRYFL